MSNLLSLTRNAETNKTGFSYNLNTGDEAPSHGYMVSMEGHETKVDEGQDLIQQTKIYIMFNADTLYDGEVYLGCWWDPETRAWYLDMSLHFETKEEAMAYGLSNNQRSIWDLENDESINLS